MVDKEEVAVVEPTLHPAVELLLARMKSNPDEFYPKGWRWQKLISEYSGYFTEVEHVAINEGQREIAVGAFHVAVMNELLREPEEAAKTVASGYPYVVTGVGSTINAGLANTAIGSTGTANVLGSNAVSSAAMTAQQIQGYNDVLRAYPSTPTTGSPPPKRWGLF